MKIFFSVGEPSADLHGSNLIRALKERDPDVECVGFGGPKMKEAGLDQHFDLTKFAIMWIVKVLINIRTFFRLAKQAEQYFKTERPDAVVLIDYPGFNWHIAKRARKYGIPVYYYGVPQLWAWAQWRIKKMRRDVSYALCKLPFEEKWYRDRGCNATFIGHPFFDELTSHQMQQDVLDEFARDDKRLVAILPGSRTSEVEIQLPGFLDAARLIQQEDGNVRFVIASFKESQAKLARRMVEEAGLDIDVLTGCTPEIIKSAHCCMACSGSVSLELMFHKVPTVIQYKVGKFHQWIGNRLLKVKYITLVNLISDPDPFRASCEKSDIFGSHQSHVPFPEYIGAADHSKPMADYIQTWLSDEHERSRRITMLAELNEKYAKPGASRRAAEFVLDDLQGQSEKDQRAAAA